jgi:hypothetical protein
MYSYIKVFAINTIIAVFSIDNAHLMYNGHPNIFNTPFHVQIVRVRQIAVKLGSASSNSSNIESDEEFFESE